MILIALAIMLCSTSALAANLYCVRTNAAGAANGADWDNAYTVLPTTLERGATYYIADGTYPSYIFDDSYSGTNAITIKKATEADHGTDTGWSSAYGDGFASLGVLRFNAGNYVIDGVTGGGPDNWDSGYGFRIYIAANTGTKAIQFNTASTPTISLTNIHISHVDISYEYNNSLPYPAGNPAVATGQDAIYCLAANLYDSSFRYMRINRPGRTAFLSRKVWDNVLVEYVFVNEPVIGYLDSTDQHGEIWSANHSAGEFRNITIRYCWFNDYRSTGGLVISGGDEVDIYGNLFELGTSGGNGVICNWSSEPVSRDVRIYNNTFAKGNGALGVGNNTAWIARNNIFVSNSIVSKSGAVDRDYSASSTVLSDANFDHVTAADFSDYDNGDYHLAANTAPGADLGAPYNTDMDEASRSTWSRGAFEFAGSDSPGVLSLSSTTHAVDENGASVDVVVVRTGGSQGVASAVLYTVNGTAEAGSDYTTNWFPVVYGDGVDGEEQVPIQIQDDGDAEGNEVFYVYLTNFVGASEGTPSSAIITIIDNEAPTVPLMPALTFEAEDGLIESLFAESGGLISQPNTVSDPALGGRARYRFTIENAGDYVVKLNVNAPDFAADTLFLQIDSEPSTPDDIVDIPLTSGVEEYTVTLRGAGAWNNPQFNPATFTLGAGEHTLEIRGREPVEIDSIEITSLGGTVPNAPSALQVTPISTSQLDLEWEDNSSDEDGFYVERDTVVIHTNAANDVTFSDTGLVPDSIYTYRVRAFNSVGESDYTAEVNGTTKPPPLRYHLPIRIVAQ